MEFLKKLIGISDEKEYIGLSQYSKKRELQETLSISEPKATRELKITDLLKKAY